MEFIREAELYLFSSEPESQQVQYMTAECPLWTLVRKTTCHKPCWQ